MVPKPLQVLFGRQKKLLETSKEEKPAAFLDVPTLFLATSVQRKAVGIVHAPGTCVLCRRVGACVREGIRALRAGCIPSPEPKPASGLGDSASMLSPKGDHDREVGRASDLWGLNREPWARGKTEVGRSATLGQAEPDSRRESFQGNTRVPQEQHEFLGVCGGESQLTLEGTSKTMRLGNGGYIVWVFLTL